MGICVQRGGPLTTVQDKGRLGYQNLGFSASGAMDRRALRLANLLLDNEENDAVLEVTMVGPKFTFESPNCFVLTGADLKASLNGQVLETNRVYAAGAGDVVDFPQSFPSRGARAYIGFAGGLDLPPLMGSRSTYLKGKMGGLEGRGLKTGDRLEFLAPRPQLPNLEKRRLPEDFETVYGGRQVKIRVILGPQEDAFTAQGIETFLSQPYTVTNDFDRMGCRLDGPVIQHKGDGNIISDGMVTGAIQVPTSGLPIIMLAERQTVGGYTKIAAVISADLPVIGQARPGDIIRFQAVSVAQAHQAWREQQARLEELEQKLNGPLPEKKSRENHYRISLNGKEYQLSIQVTES